MSIELVILFVFMAFEAGRWAAYFEISQILKLQARAHKRWTGSAAHRLWPRLDPPTHDEGPDGVDPDRGWS